MHLAYNEYYSARKKNELLTHAVTKTSLKIIILLTIIIYSDRKQWLLQRSVVGRHIIKGHEGICRGGGDDAYAYFLDCRDDSGGYAYAKAYQIAKFKYIQFF